ncbi:LacI family transcriptional regulator [Clostridia bacterium]|nr:LacI family transcriptional regulator [Clostridia bacterium]
MQRRRPTMQAIADTLGISKNAVYLALNAKSGVSSALREKVADTARRLGYGVYGLDDENSLANLKKKSRCIIAVVPEYLRDDAFFYYDILWSIESEAKKHGILLIHHTVTIEAQRAMAMPALPDGVDVVGFLVIGVLSEPYVARLHGMGAPLVSVDIPYYESPVSCVGTANHSGGYAASQYLIERGHISIGFIGPVYTARSVYERWSGFRQALEERAIPVQNEYNLIGQPGKFELFDTPEALAPMFERLAEYPSAWFCAGDRIAIAAINLLTLRGLHVPDDISVIGFDDLSIAQIILPKLTTMHVRRKHMGRIAVEQLLLRAQSHQTLSYVALPCTLIERDSVRDLNAAFDADYHTPIMSSTAGRTIAASSA